MSFVTPSDGQAAIAEHVAQLTENFSGVRNIPVTIAATTTVRSLLFSPDNTYDIGASGATRPKDIFAAGIVTVGNHVNTSMVGTTTAVALRLMAQGYDRWAVQPAGHFVAQTDNTHDIGASGANRPRDLFLGRNAAAGGNLTLSGSNARIIADWTSATQAALQTSTVNGSTQFYCLPNGTSRQSGFYAWGDSTLTNAQYCGFIMDSANNAAKLTVGKQGSGTYANLIVNTGGTDSVYVWGTGKVQVLRGPLQVDAGGLVVTGAASISGGLNYAALTHDSFWTYGTGPYDIGNASSYPGQLRGYKAWGGNATVSCTGSSGFIHGPSVLATSITITSGDSLLWMANAGYWWLIARGI